MQGQDHDLFNQPYFSSNQNSGGSHGHQDRSNAAPPFSYHSQSQHAPQTASTSSNRYDPFQGLSTAAQIDLVLQQASEQQQQEDEAGVTPENEIHSNSAAAPSTSTSSARKRSGRPRDKVWELFEGDRSLASCKFCDWKSDHPKAFRMKTHILSQCEGAPLEQKKELIQYEAEKVQAKKEKEAAEAAEAAKAAAAPENNVVVEPKAQEKVVSSKREQSSQNSSGGGGGAAAPTNGGAQNEVGPSAAKKMKREHVPVMTAHHGPPPPQTNFAPSVMAPSSATQQAPQPSAPAPRSPITCHVLDSTTGKPAPDMRIRLDRLNTTGFVLQGQGTTDKDGRCNTLLTPGTVLDVGIFKITFFTSEYFTHRGILSFYPFVEIPFEVKSPEEHYHIPCLLAPHSYTTYRGS
ncbi:hypothetical protein JCM3765_004494 [Sporobolomyces pararoseus]